MTELNDDEALILTQARRALSPTSADERRVLAAVQPRLAQSPSVTSAPSGHGFAVRRAWLLRAVGAAAVIGAIALSGGLGYRRGWQAGIAQQNQQHLRERSTTMLAPPARETGPAIEPKDPLPLVASSAAANLATRSSPGLRAVPVASATPSPPVASVASALGLDEEVRRLRRVERAVREGNPRLALVLLEDLQRAIPAGQLLEERRAASIMANCQLGGDTAVADARAFVGKYARSAYLTRVIELCGLASERNSAAPGTNVPR